MPRRSRPAQRMRRGFPHRQALLAAVLVDVFEELDVGAAVHVDATARVNEEWYPFKAHPDLVLLENAHGAERKRWRYNERCFARVRRERRVVIGEHGGFSDFFVPLGDVDDAWGTLAVGPFAITRPTSGEVLAHWRALTGKHGRMGDRGFARYLAIRLSALTLEGALLQDFERFLVSFGTLLAEGSSLEQVVASLNPMRFRLREARFAEFMWDSARTMTDERTAATWSSSGSTHVAENLSRLGLRRAPRHALVGLVLSSVAEADPVGDLLRRDAFQRACVDLVRKRGGLVCGRVEQYGVALLADDLGSARSKLVETGEQMRALAKRFGLVLHLGVGAAASGVTLPERYQAALAAAERALSEGKWLVQAERDPRSSQGPLHVLRKQLADGLAQDSRLLSPRFQRYIEAAAIRSGYRVEVLRAHLEAGWDQLVDALVVSAALDDRSFRELGESVERGAQEASTVSELSSLYQRVIRDIELAIARPKDARQERSLRRGVAFIHDRLGEPLSLSKVAKAAGFATPYFSRLFAESEGMTFRQYVRNLRVERARSMLLSTSLSVERIAGLCGFVSRVHFHRAFKVATGMTPAEYRSDEGRRKLLRPSKVT